MENILELRNVTFAAIEGNILEDITINFRKTKTTAIVGPSGSGKSTFLKLAAGILVPKEGEVFYYGKNITAMNRTENLEFRRDCGFVFQDSALWANQNLDQILELPLKIHFPQMSAKERTQRIKEAAETAGYRKKLNIRPSRLSMGEQKLIAFARAMLCDPSLLFLDEWTESLDEYSSEHLVNIVKQKQKAGASVLFVSHDMRIIRELADNVLTIVNGKISKNVTIDNIDHEILKNEIRTTEVLS